MKCTDCGGEMRKVGDLGAGWLYACTRCPFTQAAQAEVACGPT